MTGYTSTGEFGAKKKERKGTEAVIGLTSQKTAAEETTVIPASHSTQAVSPYPLLTAQLRARKTFRYITLSTHGERCYM